MTSEDSSNLSCPLSLGLSSQTGGVCVSGASTSRLNGQAETVDSVHRIGCSHQGEMRDRLSRVAGHALFLDRALSLSNLSPLEWPRN